VRSFQPILLERLPKEMFAISEKPSQGKCSLIFKTPGNRHNRHRENRKQNHTGKQSANSRGKWPAASAIPREPHNDAVRQSVFPALLGAKPGPTA
jgi:hypothetical protein